MTALLPAAWIANDADDAAIAAKGQIVALKLNTRAYATGIWATRRGLVQPKNAEATRDEFFTCDIRGGNQCRKGRLAHRLVSAHPRRAALNATEQVGLGEDAQ